MERASAEYGYSYYAEDDLEDGPAGGETERYEIHMQQFRLRVPFSDRMDLGIDLTYETMSGASPWYVAPDATTGEPVQFMSQATIDDERSDLRVNASYYYDEARLGLATGYSTERDYTALYFSVDGERHWNEKNTTLSGGLDVSFDDIEPTDAGNPLYPTRRSSADKKSYGGFVGLAQLLGRSSAVQTSLSLRHSRGFLADPYKTVFLTTSSTFIADGRPDDRTQFAWLTRYRKHFESLDTTLRADYRFFADDWDVVSHTVDLSLHRSFLERFSLSPSLRYYSQSAADFYDVWAAAAPSDGIVSSDYRLSAYGAVTVGLEGTVRFRTPWTGDRLWQGRLAWERYVSDADLAHLEPSVESPGLVSWHLLSIGIQVVF